MSSTWDSHRKLLELCKGKQESRSSDEMDDLSFLSPTLFTFLRLCTLSVFMVKGVGA